MQMPTHFLFAILLYNLISKVLEPFIYIPLMILLAVISHALLDCVAIMTYHPPEAQKQDKFWVIYHVLIYLASIVLFIVFFKEYWWVMLASIIPDIVDWYIFRPILKRAPVFHPQIDYIRSKLFFWLPVWNMKKWTVVFEFALVAGLSIGIWLTYPF